MYVPLLKARAEELRAVEACGDYVRRGAAFPILDPCDPTREMWSKLRRFANDGLRMSVVTNPQHGALSGNAQPLIDAFMTGDLGVQQQVISPAFQLRPGQHLGHLKAFLDRFRDRDVSLVISDDATDRAELGAACRNHGAVRLVALANGLKSNYRPGLENCKFVVFNDGFQSASQNANYPSDSPFFDVGQALKGKPLDGYGDYATIGSDFSPGGFIPKAVAVHLSYESSSGVIRVRHFVSVDKKEQVSGLVKKKTMEALGQLVSFVNSGDVAITDGCAEFVSSYENGDPPALGKLKKLSLQHHIELMSDVVGRYVSS